MSTLPHFVAQGLHNTVLGKDGTSSSRKQGNCCFDTRFPNENTVIYGTSNGYSNIQGFLPAGSYGFTDNGYVVNSCSGIPIPVNSLFSRTSGPIYGATMGSCVARGVTSSILDFHSGEFSPLPSTLARKCFS